MRILLRIVAGLVALALLVGVIYLGILSGRDAKFVVWFGIASAIAAPGGFALLGYSFAGSDSQVIRQLAQVPEIGRLIAESKTRAEKVRILQEEEARVAEVIRLESRRQAVRDRTESLERDGLRIIQELDALTEEARVIDLSAGKGIASEEIERLRQRVRARGRGDIILRFGNRSFIIDRGLVGAMPFGSILLSYLRVVERIQNLT